MNIPSRCGKLSKNLLHDSLHSIVSSRARKISAYLLWSAAIYNRPFEKPFPEALHFHFQRDCCYEVAKNS